MEKSLIEKFVEEHDLTLELEIYKDFTLSYLYKKSDLYLMCFRGKTMNEAINAAVDHYKERVNGHSTE